MRKKENHYIEVGGVKAFWLHILANVNKEFRYSSWSYYIFRLTENPGGDIALTSVDENIVSVLEKLPNSLKINENRLISSKWIESFNEYLKSEGYIALPLADDSGSLPFIHQPHAYYVFLTWPYMGR